MAINRLSSGAGIWCPSCQDWAFGTPLPRTGNLVSPRWFGPRILADLEIWYPDFCQLRRFGSRGSEKRLVAKSPHGFRGYQTSRFAQGRVPNLGSCREKVPNRPVLPRIFLLGVPNLRSWQLPSPLGTKPAFLTGSSSAGKPLGETPEADPSCLAPTVNRNTSNACQLPMSLPKDGDYRS